MLLDFFSEEEKLRIQAFLDHKFIIADVENKELLFQIQYEIAQLAAKSAHIDLPERDNVTEFLNQFHHKVSLKELNDIRLFVISKMNRLEWFRVAYYHLGKSMLSTLLGNELAMQRRINLSIQFPQDDSSLLPVHADVWSGDSPYEIVMWLPLVDCFNTKSMYLCDASHDSEFQNHLSQFKQKSSEDLFQAIQDKVNFLNVPFGKALFFSQNVMHGNRINQETETRWSMNCRFKGALTPYHGKKLGEFFEPITLRPCTQIGLEYSLPEGFDE